MLTVEELYNKPIEIIYNGSVVQNLNNFEELEKTNPALAGYLGQILNRVITSELMERGSGVIQRIDELTADTRHKGVLKILPEKLTLETFILTKHEMQEEEKSWN